mgnify:CR=1 FL=1
MRGGIGDQLQTCPLRPEEAFEQCDQFIERGAAAPQPRVVVAPAVPEDIDETVGLAGLEGVRPRIAAGASRYGHCSTRW